MKNKILFATLFIGILFFLGPWAYSQDLMGEDIPVQPSQQEQSIKDNKDSNGVELTDTNAEKIKDEEDGEIEVEKARPHGVKKNCNCKVDAQVPYRDRREAIGWTFGFQWVNYDPTNYHPNFSAPSQTFDTYYSGGGGSAEINLGVKWNFILGSIGPQITAGFYKATNDTKSATFQVIPITAGLTYYMDNLFPNPYVVPYVTGGMYTGIYNETQQGSTVKGNSAFAMFYSVGVGFQLDWIDPDAHDSAYEDYGFENTFIFVEMRSFLEPTLGTGVPDLSTPLQLAAGLKFEF